MKILKLAGVFLTLSVLSFTASAATVKISYCIGGDEDYKDFKPAYQVFLKVNELMSGFGSNREPALPQGCGEATREVAAGGAIKVGALIENEVGQTFDKAIVCQPGDLPYKEGQTVHVYINKGSKGSTIENPCVIKVD